MLTINENVCSDPTSCVLCFFFFAGDLWAVDQTLTWAFPCGSWSSLDMFVVTEHFSVLPPAPGVAVDGEQCNPYSTPQNGAITIPAVAQDAGFWLCSPVAGSGLAVPQLHFSSLQHLVVGLERGKSHCWSQREGRMGKFGVCTGLEMGIADGCRPCSGSVAYSTFCSFRFTGIGSGCACPAPRAICSGLEQSVQPRPHGARQGVRWAKFHFYHLAKSEQHRDSRAAFGNCRRPQLGCGAVVLADASQQSLVAHRHRVLPTYSQAQAAFSPGALFWALPAAKQELLPMSSLMGLPQHRCRLAGLLQHAQNFPSKETNVLGYKRSVPSSAMLLDVLLPPPGTAELPSDIAKPPHRPMEEPYQGHPWDLTAPSPTWDPWSCTLCCGGATSAPICSSAGGHLTRSIP